MGRPGEPRKLKKEYKDYHSKPTQKKKRAERNAANNALKKEGRIAAGDGKNVHHKKPLRKGGTNAKKNLTVVSAKKNKGWRKGKKGYS